MINLVRNKKKRHKTTEISKIFANKINNNNKKVTKKKKENNIKARDLMKFRYRGKRNHILNKKQKQMHFISWK